MPWRTGAHLEYKSCQGTFWIFDESIFVLHHLDVGIVLSNEKNGLSKRTYEMALLA